MLFKVISDCATVIDMMQHNILSVVCSNHVSILGKLLVDITIGLMDQELKPKLHYFDLLWICCTTSSTTNPHSTTSRHVEMLCVCCWIRLCPLPWHFQFIRQMAPTSKI